MNASANFLLVASLCILGSGCATDDLAVRVIEIRAVQIETESAGHAGLSASVATSLFRDVASRLGILGHINTPRNPTKPTWVKYAVSFNPESSIWVNLTMDIDGKQITFRGDTVAGKPEGDAALQKAIKLFRESLDERHIKYKVRTYTEHIYFEKS